MRDVLVIISIYIYMWISLYGGGDVNIYLLGTVLILDVITASLVSISLDKSV